MSVPDSVCSTRAVGVSLVSTTGLLVCCGCGSRDVCVCLKRSVKNFCESLRPYFVSLALQDPEPLHPQTAVSNAVHMIGHMLGLRHDEQGKDLYNKQNFPCC